MTASNEALHPIVPFGEGLTEPKPLSERLNDFRETLDGVKDLKAHFNLVLDFNLDDPVENANSYFRQQELTDSPHVPSRLYLHPNVLPNIDEGPVSSIKFSHLLTRLGGRSVHGVFFGNLSITSGSEQTTIPVAVKPHEDDTDANESCLQDYTKNLAATEVGIYTLKPIGFINGRKRAYSITQRINYAPTLDSIDWSNYYPHMDDNPGMNTIWSQVARQAAMLHSMGYDDTNSEGSMMHGDLAARNIAQSVDGSVFFLDWERAHISLQPSARSLRFARYDLNVLAASMCVAPSNDPKQRGGIGIFTGKDGDWAEGFKNIFFSEYAEYCMSFAKPGKQQEAVGRKLVELESGLQATFDKFRQAA